VGGSEWMVGERIATRCKGGKDRVGYNWEQEGGKVVGKGE